MEGEDNQHLVTSKPNVSSGNPCISGTGIMCQVLYNRYMAGDSIEELCFDYDLSLAEVGAAIGYWQAITEKTDTE